VAEARAFSEASCARETDVHGEDAYLAHLDFRDISLMGYLNGEYRCSE
jgi:hypothetical protein